MDRRLFIQIVGCTGAGLLVGGPISALAGTTTASARPQTPTHRNRWMHGSTRDGCARLPIADSVIIPESSFKITQAR